MSGEEVEVNEGGELLKDNYVVVRDSEGVYRSMEASRAMVVSRRDIIVSVNGNGLPGPITAEGIAVSVANMLEVVRTAGVAGMVAKVADREAIAASMSNRERRRKAGLLGPLGRPIDYDNRPGGSGVAP